ncbi:MAG TPA: magnesium transporter CorA family protein [Opitutaceae bacterium]|nr:magnesium transporter CorA family protein [Opitutaceae bacterium]
MISSLVYRDQKQAGHNVPVESLAAIRAETNTMVWIDLAAPSEDEVRIVLQELFAFHPLAIEDCVSDSPSPKLEPYDEYLYLVMHALVADEKRDFHVVELDLFLGKNYLVTYHRDPLAVLDATIERYLKAPSLQVRGPDRFAHTLLDKMVESYRPVMDKLHQKVDRIEEGVLGSISADQLFPKIVSLRKQISQIRRVIEPEREIIADLSSGKQTLIRSILVPYLRDLAEELERVDHQAAVWAEQLILSFRIYLNKTTHEANQGIRVLTGLTALTFPALIVGSWFGMNFSRMHELKAPYGYALATALTIALTYATYLFMRRRKWL